MPRPKLPESEKRVTVSFSLPGELSELLKKHPNASRLIEQLLWENLQRITGAETPALVPVEQMVKDLRELKQWISDRIDGMMPAVVVEGDRSTIIKVK